MALVSQVAIPAQEVTEKFSFTFERVDDSARLAISWRAIEDRSDTSFFQSWDWIDCWLAEAQIKPWLLMGWQSGKVALMALFVPSRQRRHLVLRTDTLLLHQLGEKNKDILSIGYNGFVVDSDADLRIIGAAIEYLRCVSAVRFIEVQLNSVSEAYRDDAQSSGLRTVLVSRNHSWRVDLHAIRQSGRSYLDHLSANTRYQIRRAIRLYRVRGELTATAARDQSEALDFLDHLKELNTTYWASRQRVASFAYPFFERFHRNLITRCLAKGSVELVRISAGNTLLGYLYNFIYKARVYAYQSGFVYENDAKLKPGLVSHQLCIEQHLRRGANTYDFLAGYGRYKANLGGAGPDIIDLSLQRPSFALRLEDLLRAAKRRVVNKIVSRNSTYINAEE